MHDEVTLADYLTGLFAALRLRGQTALALRGGDFDSIICDLYEAYHRRGVAKDSAGDVLAVRKALKRMARRQTISLDKPRYIAIQLRLDEGDAARTLDRLSLSPKVTDVLSHQFLQHYRESHAAISIESAALHEAHRTLALPEVHAGRFNTSVRFKGLVKTTLGPLHQHLRRYRRLRPYRRLRRYLRPPYRRLRRYLRPPYRRLRHRLRRLGFGRLLWWKEPPWGRIGSFRHSLKAEISRSARLGKDVGLVLIDMDDFTPLNTTFGVAQGDLVCKEVACLLERIARDAGARVRYAREEMGGVGGEEMYVVVRHPSSADLERFAERMRVAIEELKIPCLGGPGTLSVTASFGVASLHDSSTRKVDLISPAEAALRRAKQAGKNRVEWADGTSV